MKICHIITRLILGGAQENTILTCEGLHNRGHDVTLVTGPALGPEGELLTRARSGGYRVVVLDALRREINPWRDWQSYRQICRFLAADRPDVMHSHSSKAGIIARRAAAKVGGMKIVHTIHGLPYHRYQAAWRNWLYITLEKAGARRSDAIISVADAMTKQALEAGVGMSGQYRTIYSGMEADVYSKRPKGAGEFRASLNLPGDAVLVTQVARLAELKGHEYIIEAAGRIDDPRVHFCFVGDGHWRGRIEADIASRGLSDRFHLTGLVPPDYVPTVLHTSDILVHCSLREGLARALPQGMLAGLPVISFDVDGAREVVDETTGVLLVPKDVDGLTAAIARLAGDNVQRATLGDTGRKRCTEMFSHHKMVDEIEKLYESLD